MTGDDGSGDAKQYPVYIPPVQGSGGKEKPLPEMQKGEDWNGLAIIVIGMIILVAAFQLFIIIMQLISTWIADELVPFISAAFDVILIAGGIWLIRNYFQKK